MAEFSAPIGAPVIRGMTRKNQRITISSGMERIRLTYQVAAIAKGAIGERRASASRVPRTMPPDMAIRVSLTVNSRPVQRNGRLGAMTLASKLAKKLI